MSIVPLMIMFNLVQKPIPLVLIHDQKLWHLLSVSQTCQWLQKQKILFDLKFIILKSHTLNYFPRTTPLM